VLTNNPENIDYLAEVIVSHLLAGKKSDMSGVSIRLLGIFPPFLFKRCWENNVTFKYIEGRGMGSIPAFVKDFMISCLKVLHTYTRKYFKIIWRPSLNSGSTKKKRKLDDNFSCRLSRSFIDITSIKMLSEITVRTYGDGKIGDLEVKLDTKWSV